MLNFLISLVPSFLWCLDTVQELKEKALSRYNLVRVSVPSTPSSPSQLEWMIGLPWPNTRGSLKSPS